MTAYRRDAVRLFLLLTDAPPMHTGHKRSAGPLPQAPCAPTSSTGTRFPQAFPDGLPYAAVAP